MATTTDNKISNGKSFQKTPISSLSNNSSLVSSAADRVGSSGPIQISKSNEKESIIYVMAMVLWLVCYGIVKLIPVILLFRVRKLITVLTDLKKVDQILNKIPDKRCHSRQRTVVGFLCVISMVSIMSQCNFMYVLIVNLVCFFYR